MQFGPIPAIERFRNSFRANFGAPIGGLAARDLAQVTSNRDACDVVDRQRDVKDQLERRSGLTSVNLVYSGAEF